MPVTETHDPTQTRRLEMILRQVDALPTLPMVATRLLALTSSDDSDANEVISLISSDQALTAKVLSMVRAANRGVRDVTTVDRAVVLLGFEAIRNAVLSVKVIELFENTPMGQGGKSAKKAGSENRLARALKESEKKGGTGPSNSLTEFPPTEAGDDILPTRYCFDHIAFWRHSLAVAVAAERIAATHPGDEMLRPADAFVCGLVHDIGKLALERVLPKSYQRVIELVEINQGNIAEFERRIIGMDHHTAGKRLSEQWQLPHLIQDCVWLHGSSYDTVPPLPHRRMIGLITLADLLARHQHVGFSGNLSFRQQVAPLVEQLGLDPAKVNDVAHDLHEHVATRAAALGLDDTPSQGSFLRAIQQANEMLGRLNSALARRSQLCTRQQQVLETIAAFHSAATPGRSVEDVIVSVVESAVGVMGQGYYGVVYQLATRGQWQINAYHEGRVVASHVMEPPPGAPDLATLDPNHPAMLNQMGILPWLADYLGNEVDVRQVRMLPLGCGWGTAAILLHDRPVLPAWQLLSAVTNTWGAAIAAAAQHEGARRLGEQLADANHALADAQDRLLRSESMARLGEMAGGAAHEMNNPLAVISGRSQLLAQSLPNASPEQKAAQTIVTQAHRLSDLITSLRLYADPPKATRRPTDIAALLDDTVKRLSKALPRQSHCPINLQVRKDMPTVWVDGEQIRNIIVELLTNSIQSAPKSGVHVSARIDPVRSALVIQVADDGSGMDEHTLSHAMDPFFSARSAGRGVGMGLPRAGQFAAAHGGTIELRSTAGEGTLATVILPLDSHA